MLNISNTHFHDRLIHDSGALQCRTQNLPGISCNNYVCACCTSDAAIVGLMKPRPAERLSTGACDGMYDATGGCGGKRPVPCRSTRRTTPADSSEMTSTHTSLRAKPRQKTHGRSTGDVLIFRRISATFRSSLATDCKRKLQCIWNGWQSGPLHDLEAMQ
eukprot:29717-Chlamydomonas_euryale.AAC.5